MHNSSLTVFSKPIIRVFCQSRD